MRLTSTESKQALRMHRFLMAAATYAVCGALAQVSAWLGYLPAALPAWWVLGAAVVNGTFFVAIRRGWNLRLRDPSMTELQLLVSMIAASVLISQNTKARGAFLLLLPVPMLFGCLRLNLRQMARIGAIGVLCYASLIGVDLLRHRLVVPLSLELLNLVSLATVMGFVCIMGGHISKVRGDLAAAVAAIGEQALRDPLTGLFNRRHLMDRLDLEVSRCTRRTSLGITLLMVDIDWFKRINDTLGHLVGDEVLAQMGKHLVASIRDVDYAARYGGEEFVVVLEAATERQVLATCERIRAAFEQMPFPAHPELAITVSIGVATYVPGEHPLDLLERADQALYAAKSAGRNCIRIAPAATEPLFSPPAAR